MSLTRLLLRDRMFDGYVMFTGDRLTATLIKGLRNELQALLQAKVNPQYSGCPETEDFELQR